ncbi:MAG: pyruvate, phosphate dikinase [Bradymonadales bacterium]|nr:pyruvate, phosphate dikinase [Bradymonadales bacterium]
MYFFGADDPTLTSLDRNVVGGKGAGMAHMSRLKIPVPPGFTITTEMCLAYQRSGRLPDGLEEEVYRAVAKVEAMMAEQTGGDPEHPTFRFGDPSHPLLLSVRSGARASMPGMMDTVLNLGLNDTTIEGLMAISGDRRFALDSYRRFIQMYGDVVMGVAHDLFEHALSAARKDAGVKLDNQLTDEQLQRVIREYKEIVARHAGRPLPSDPREQLLGAIRAVFDSWNNQRAITYRRLNNIPDNWGTAVNVQVMVFGNMGDDSATGVAFTRNPATGERKFYGEFLINAQGEDVVAGIRTPHPISKGASQTLVSLEEAMPAIYQELLQISEVLEQHFTDMQDIEFTVQKGKLWMLQTRTGKRTAEAAVRIAVEMVDQGLIDIKEALHRVKPDQLDQLLHPRLDPKASKEVLAVGLPASPGAVSGAVVFTPEDAERLAELGQRTILVRIETSPEDIQGMASSEGTLTARGGMTSHAAVVSRGMGKPCVAGCGAIEVDYDQELFKVKDRIIRKGEVITLDGAAGEVILGDVPRLPPSFEGPVKQLVQWADEVRTLGIRTNADTPHDAAVARGFGAEGIGLCRTEHMFFAADRIDQVRQMILSDTAEDRREILKNLLVMQQQDFEGIFAAMDGYPVTIRLLDPPLHEFLPREDEEQEELAERIGREVGEIRTKIEALHEFNPMLGHRGVRLGVTFPDVYQMQVRAILQAAIQSKRAGVVVLPEIMVPLVATRTELELVKTAILQVAQEVFQEMGERLDFLVGTMIELPRACIVADQIAQEAQFFSFGTNDLTQTAFGLSRDDAGKFLPIYVKEGILPKDPFVALDQDGVGELVRIGVNKGRGAKPNLKVGICGEHGGEPSSIAFFHRIGLNYVSCSPYRVPVARLAAAQAALED